MTATQTAPTARRIGASETEVVPIALGAMLMGTSTPEDQARRILDHFIGEVTPRFVRSDGMPAPGMIDTADCYCWWEAPGEAGGHSESVLGRWMADAGARDRVFLATKGSGWVDGAETAWKDGVADWEYARQHFVGASARVLSDSVEASLERLGADRIDLYYVHVDDLSTPLDESLETLAALVAVLSFIPRFGLVVAALPVVQRADMAARADPRAVRAARLAAAGRAPAAALVPAPQGGTPTRLDRGRRAARLPRAPP